MKDLPLRDGEHGEPAASSGCVACSKVWASSLSMSGWSSCSFTANTPPQPYSAFSRMHAFWTVMLSTLMLKPLPKAVTTFTSPPLRMIVFTQEPSVNCRPTRASGTSSWLGSQCSLHLCSVPSFITPSISTYGPSMRTMERALPRLLAGLNTLLPQASERDVSAVTTSSPVLGCRTTVGLWPCGWCPERRRRMPDLARNSRTRGDRWTGFPLTNGL
mmetsp:Transcript_110151/g.351009  ORF Transcript_110151/g.351009 Transcript_110151/m.351009 type:complete len:216 (+) Transcript_110151:1863-2510(+)